MASPREREHLARAARALNAQSGRSDLPPLIFMTDEKRTPDPVAVAWALPKDTAIILRHTDARTRAWLAEALQPVAEQRGLRLLVAGDTVLAAGIGAAGVHLSEARVREALDLKARHSSWLITAAAHSEDAIARAARAGADAILLAPVFATASHKDRPALGTCRFRLMAMRAPVPIYALGGISAANSGRLAGACIAGIAAIGGLRVDQRA